MFFSRYQVKKTKNCKKKHDSPLFTAKNRVLPEKKGGNP
jgi:hypothetical protein